MPHHALAHHQHARSNYRVRNVQPVVEKAETVVNVVYVTAAPTFDGPIGGYKTLDGPSPLQTSSEQTPIAAVAVPAEPSSSPMKSAPAVLAQSSPDTIPSASPATQVVPSSPAESNPTQQAVDQPPSTTPAQTTQAKTASSTPPSPSSAVALSSHETENTQQSSPKTFGETLVPTTSTGLSSSQSETPTVATPVNAQSATSSSPAVSTTSSGGMSGGAKAGLAIGILLAIAALAGLIFFCFRRRKNHRNEAYGRTNDEKGGLGDEGAAAGLGRSASVQTSTTSATAPRLSLRPVTQFLPDIAAQRKSGNNLAAAGGPLRHGTPVANDADREKALINSRTSDPGNPFGSHAEMSEKLPIQSNSENPANPFGNHAETDRQLTQVSAEPEVVPPAPLRIRTPTPDGKMTMAGAGIAAVGAAGAMAGEKQNIPKPLNLSPNRAASPAMNGIPSPTASDFSVTLVSPESFANGPPPSNVHRIQLDFKPSMDDELELRAGQLVRLLHEYDDGWVSWVI